jgi:hypothetical protein
MSKVKVLAAIEFAIGTAKLVNFGELGEGTISVSDLPSLSFEVTQLDTGLQHTLHLVLEGNGSSRGSYDQMQLQELVQVKLVEMLRLEDVVKLYGNLKLDMPEPEAFGDMHMHHHRPHPLEFASRELVNRLFGDEEHRHSYHHSDTAEIRHMTDGSWKLSVKLGHGLRLNGTTRAQDDEDGFQRPRAFGGYHSSREGRKEEDYRVKGEFFLGDEKFRFMIHHEEFPIGKHLVFTELAHTAALKLAKEFPFLNIDVKKFTKAVVAA